MIHKKKLQVISSFQFCIKEYILFVASQKTGCFVLNKVKLCHAYLTKCINFIHKFQKKNKIEILKWKISEDV